MNKLVDELNLAVYVTLYEVIKNSVAKNKSYCKGNYKIIPVALEIEVDKCQRNGYNKGVYEN
jgi:hypothetical protein